MQIEIGNLAGGRFERVEALLDTRAPYTWVPRSQRGAGSVTVKVPKDTSPKTVTVDGWRAPRFHPLSAERGLDRRGGDVAIEVALHPACRFAISSRTAGTSSTGTSIAVWRPARCAANLPRQSRPHCRSAGRKPPQR